MVELPKLGYFKKLKLSGELTRFVVIALTSVSVSVFCVLGLLSQLNIVAFESTSSVDFFIFAILSGTGIFGMYEYYHFRRIYKIDSIFPDFVRDLASSRRAGMTFTNAILFTSKGNYGFLTDEIKKMAMQISWGSSIEDALKDLAKRIKTKSVQRTISLIIEASRSGGNVADVLDVAANDARELKLLESERRVNMVSYIIVIYVAMFVFIAIIAILAGVFLPAITGSEAEGLSTTMGGTGAINAASIIQVFYFATIMQGIGTGIVAGIFEDGYIQSSVKHIFILILSCWVIFKFILGA